MTLKATVPAVEFSNFSLKVLGELTVEPDVAFTGVVDQVRMYDNISVYLFLPPQSNGAQSAAFILSRSKGSGVPRVSSRVQCT